MLLSASLVPITIVTEDFDKAVILTEALKGQAQSCALQLQSSMRLSRILSISDLNPLPGDQALSWWPGPAPELHMTKGLWPMW